MVQRDRLVIRQLKKTSFGTIMATPSEKLAQSLEILHALQNANGEAAIRARDINILTFDFLLSGHKKGAN